MPRHILQDNSGVAYAPVFENITEARRGQEEMRRRQKLESLGILAGGSAYDFNNLLGGILAQAELIGLGC